MFSKFAVIVYATLQRLLEGRVFETCNGDELWELYLKSFPTGTNTIFKKRTEHDCSCCRQFIRRIGNITNGIETIWDDAAKDAPYPYNIVASEMRRYVLSKPIVDKFYTDERSFGTKESRSMDKESKVVTTWNHFYTDVIPKEHCPKDTDTKRGDYRTTVGVFERGLKKLKPEAITTVLELINGNNLYRGEEHKNNIIEFQQVQTQYNRAENKELFVWVNGDSKVARFRNTVIGTLLVDLSEGVELDDAVRAFETKVAPQNYKRTTALITPMMIKKAMDTIRELGLEPSLERRFATIENINVNDVKWVDNGVKDLMKGGLEAALMKESFTPSNRPMGVVEEGNIDDFFEKLKTTTSLELYVENKHNGNFVSLTAPVKVDTKSLFKWDNDFAWSYTGNVADSIKERVKKAGGKVQGELRVSLSWYNYDDLDLHIKEPQKYLYDEIYFRNKKGWTGGELDVDMNAGHGTTKEPVENVIWTARPPDGRYKIIVNNFKLRERENPGFVIEVEANGIINHYSYNKIVKDKEDIEVCTIVVKDGMVTFEEINGGVTKSLLSQNKWGLKTESFVKVNAVTLSPNYWGWNKVGNKHLFLFLDGCVSDEETRGIYNEFLSSSLEAHRKVFEMIGEKTKCSPTEKQLSGLGFSSTKHENVLVRINNKRPYLIRTGG
jgi:hypothetical protein